MLKFSRRNKRLVIPVGINPNYGIDKADLYNTNDADVLANDVLEGKIAYGKDGKIVGTLDVQSEIEESYQEGYEFGYDEGNEAGYRLGYDEGNEAGITEQKAKLEGITITENGSYNREDGWNEVIVDVQDLNGDYNEGVEDGIEIGKAEIIEGMNDATITAGTVFKGEVGYGKDGERIVGEYESLDFSVLGYTTMDATTINDNTIEDIEYSEELLQNWNGQADYFKNNSKLVYLPLVDTSNITNMSQMFYGCYALNYVPLLDTSKVNNMSSMFYGCYNLKNVQLFDTSKVTSMSQMFSGCYNLKNVPLLDTSKVSGMNDMFRFCSELVSVPLFDTSNATNMGAMFQYCYELVSVPLFDTSNVTNMAAMFERCRNLTSVPQFNTSKVTSMSNMFADCLKLTTIPEFDASKFTIMNYTATAITNGNTPLVNFGGFKDLGKSYSGSTSNSNYVDVLMEYNDKLSYESCMNIINKVYDMNLNTLYTGVTPRIRFHATPYSLLTSDDIAIATAKGWTVQAG